jgi:hypothetical protein
LFQAYKPGNGISSRTHMTDSEAVTHQSVPIHLVIFDLANRVGFKVATSLVTLVSDWDRSSDGRSI